MAYSGDVAASDNLGLQFQYHAPSMGYGHHRIVAQVEGNYAGHLLWTSNGIRNIDVTPTLQRQGVATAMWNEGHRLAEEHGRIPKPKHSPDRTDEGDAWARAVGGRLPRRNR